MRVVYAECMKLKYGMHSSKNESEVVHIHVLDIFSFLNKNIFGILKVHDLFFKIQFSVSFEEPSLQDVNLKF